ncbi:hypothetical protein Nisw_08670 [Candidatus Nitrosopumilus sp. SW]|uniref:2OG-Fe(II)-dependent halogenase WelO5 family protein n=1 Tax=Candidatus Nitrosopumilus sp. SW TaxID=2508726 RepID=UPI0011508E62|nr:hypothetical protein [Candidatus Nitrosopumilus sp. SW]QDI89586.1 hypothetical protein Nisw_08670 [Candidatus Nitrosopumilus sp. SW]
MWKPIIIKNQNISGENFKKLLSGQIPALVIKNFYSKNQCISLVKKIEKSKTKFDKTQLEHIGPFLMAHTTKKKEYFYKSKEFQKTWDCIFKKVQNPLLRVDAMINNSLPSFSMSLAKQSEGHFSPFVIRIHRKGKSIPIHKDNVQYEGKEYFVSNIDHQLSCVIHLQESELGGDVIIYKNQWKKKDERYRNIDFGYSQNVVSTEFCRLSNINNGDLVIINPNYYHEVTKILGDRSRITLGMFLGIRYHDKQIFAWA